MIAALGMIAATCQFFVDICRHAFVHQASIYGRIGLLDDFLNVNIVIVLPANAQRIFPATGRITNVGLDKSAGIITPGKGYIGVCIISIAEI